MARPSTLPHGESALLSPADSVHTPSHPFASPPGQQKARRPASFTPVAGPAIPRLSAFRFHSGLLPDPDERSVLVYLPAAYAASPNRRFPVLYLHDGQNLFDDKTSYIPGHTWRAHTTADRLTEEGAIEPLILVGIANTGLRRMAEYTPSRDPKLGGGEGETYGRLLIEELKPFLDSNFRTHPDPANTGLGGSSLGGLISLALGFEYPNIFGKLGILSPSLWWDHRSILDLIGRTGPRLPLRIWLDMGTAEGARHLRDTDLLFDTLRRRGWQPGVDLAYERIEGAVHTEDAWANRFDDVLRFLYPAP